MTFLDTKFDFQPLNPFKFEVFFSPNRPTAFFILLFLFLKTPWEVAPAATTAVGGGYFNFFIFLQKILSSPFLTPAETKILVLLSTLIERFCVSRMRDYFLNFFFGILKHLSRHSCLYMFVSIIYFCKLV